jgi:hypothetical protein
MNPRWNIVLLVGVASTAFIGGLWLRPVPKAQPRAETAVSRNVMTAAAPAPAGMTPSAIRTILREELEAREAGRVAPTPTGKIDADDAERAPSAPAEPTYEQQVSYDKALKVVSAATSNAIWRVEDRESVREAWPHLTREQRRELVNSVFPLVNEGKLQVDLRGPLF